MTEVQYGSQWLAAPISVYFDYSSDQIDDEVCEWCRDHGVQIGNTMHGSWWIKIPDESTFVLFKLSFACPNPVWGYPRIRFLLEPDGKVVKI